MRALAVLVLALGLALVAATAGAHAHATDHGRSHCAVCVLRAADVAGDEAPDVSPREREVGEVAVEARPSPVCGAPLGAVPGQSPPGRA